MRRTGDGHWMYECSSCRHAFRVRRSDSELLPRSLPLAMSDARPPQPAAPVDVAPAATPATSRRRVHLPDLDVLVDVWRAHTAPIAVALLAIVAGILIASL
jgi:hypothetical protein